MTDLFSYTKYYKEPKSIVHFRVIGVKKLRVIDASIFPSPVSGVPNTILIAVTERASKLILKESDTMS